MMQLNKGQQRLGELLAGSGLRMMSCIPALQKLGWGEGLYPYWGKQDPEDGMKVGPHGAQLGKGVAKASLGCKEVQLGSSGSHTSGGPQDSEI